MVCKTCGKNLYETDTPETRSIIDGWKENMKKLSCDELYKEYLLARVYHVYIAAEELLIERGHNELDVLA